MNTKRVVLATAYESGVNTVGVLGKEWKVVAMEDSEDALYTTFALRLHTFIADIDEAILQVRVKR